MEVCQEGGLEVEAGKAGQEVGARGVAAFCSCCLG